VSERIRGLLGRVAAQTGRDPADDDLRERLPPRSGVGSVEQEIAREVAYSLGKAGRLLEQAIEQAQRARAELERAALGTAERGLLVDRFNAARAHAERRLRDLLIQREALGWRSHSEVKQAYVIPPALPDTLAGSD
jgi:hypothetical protein